MFDPIQEKRSQRYTRQELKDFWQGPGSVVQRLKKENPALYQELHTAGEQAGVIGKSLAPTPALNTPYKPPTRTYSADELAARGRYSEQDIRAFFADAKTANALFHSDRNEYEARREAGVTYGLFQAREVPYVPAKPAEAETLHRVSDQLCDESSIPRGSLLPWVQIEQLCEQQVQRARKAQADADAKIAQDRAAELEKLTARQQADQAERDRKQADLDRLAVLIAPKPIVTPEPTALATARLVAAEKAKAVEVPVKA
jgi:hypothetical protein